MQSNRDNEKEPMDQLDWFVVLVTSIGMIGFFAWLILFFLSTAGKAAA